MHFSRHGLSPALYGELACMIVGVAGKGAKSRQRGDVENESAAEISTFGILGLTHDFDATHGHTRRPEKQRLDLLMALLFRGGFGVAGQGVPSVVDHDVEVEVLPEVLRGRVEGRAH